MNFIKTIRFKLTFLYSALLVFLSVFFVTFVNILVTNFYDSTSLANIPDPAFRSRNMVFIQRIDEFTEKQRLAIDELRKDDLRQIRSFSLLSLIPLTFISFIGGYFISGKMLNPVKDLNTQIKTIRTSNLHEQIQHEDVGDEISELVNNFNDMLSRLSHSFELQKQFVENASHELKTPLTIIRTNLESMDKKVRKDEGYLTAVQSVTFMNNLIEDLLLLSVLDKDIEMSKVELIQLTQKSITQLRPLTKPKQQLNFESKLTKAFVLANEDLLQRAIMNVIENAIKYSEKEITISIAEVDNQYRLSIKDKGEGIDEKHLEQIFERFYRVDKSRSRKSGGTGLGLAIAKRVIELFKGSIEAKSIKKVGTEFILTFPKAD